MRTARATMAAALVLILAAPGPAQADAGSVSAAWSGADWWLAYDDSQLRALIEQGLANAPRMAGARAKAKRAQAAADGTAAAGRPSLLALGAMNRLDAGDGRLGQLAAPGDGRTAAVGAGLLLSHDLDLWGKRRDDTAAARAEARAAMADADATALLVSTRIARAYGELAALLELRDLLQRGLAVRQDMLVSARRRRDAGAAPASDALTADHAVAQAGAHAAACDEAIVRARAELALWMGAPPEAMANLARPRLRVGDSLADGRIEAGGPELAAAGERLAAAGSRVDAARAAYFPDLRLVLAGAQIAGGNGLLGGGGLSALGSTLQLPVLDGGRRRARLRLARAERDLAAAVRDEKQQQRVADAFAAATAHPALIRQVAHQRAAVAARTAIWESMRRRFEAGDADASALLAAEDGLLAERQHLLTLESRRFQLELDVVEATGGGWRAAGGR